MEQSNRRNSSRRNRDRALRIEPLEPRQLLAVAVLEASDDTFLRSGQNNGAAEVLDSRFSFVPYIKFDLSSLNIDEIANATLTVTKVASARNDTINTGRFAVYGLASQPGNTLQSWNESTLVGGTNSGAEWNDDSATNGIDRTRLVSLDAEDGANVIETVVNGTDVPQSLTGPDLVAFLNSRVDEDGLVTFVIPIEAGDGRGYGLASKENSNSSLRPKLEITYTEGEPPPSPENPVSFPRQVERLDRGVVVVRPNSSTAYVGWRMLGNDPADVAFNLYRSTAGRPAVKLNAVPLVQTTDFVDQTANFSSTNEYHVRAVIGGVEQPASASFTLPAFAPVQQHLDIPLSIPPGGTTPTGESYSYNANDANVGDLNGDGQYEVILKWDPSNSKDNSQSGYTGNVYVDAYSLEGQLLWRIDLGRNIRAGAHYTQMLVYDLDGDGRAEVVMRTAPGTIDGQGNAVVLAGDNPNADYRNSSGYILTGPEYLTVFDGLTGGELVSMPFVPQRGSASEWGDSYGNRVDRFLSGVAYLDGQRPSIVWARGYYGPQNGFNARNEVVALDYRDGQLTQRWLFAAATNGDNPEYIGQGSNAMSIGDVDGDGFDEIIHGAAAIDHDGTGVYSTGLGHGDALHMSDMDPSNPGLEVFMTHESPGAYQSGGRDAGGELRDAQTGELLFQIPSNNDVGRGVAMDIDPNHIGYEFWATTNEGTRMIYNVSGEALYPTPSNMMYNFGVWWDADLSRELLDGTTISDWNNPGRTNLVSSGSGGINNSSHLSGNNGTKNTPSLTADILGDWREEVIWRRSDNSALEIWTTTIPATSRLTTLMHDTQYRVSIDWQNVAYNQPPHPSFWIGEGMQTPPQPRVFFGGELKGDYNNDGRVTLSDYSVWRDNLGSTTALAADGNHSGMVDAADLAIWKDNLGAVAAPPQEFALASVSLSTAFNSTASETENHQLDSTQLAFALLSEEELAFSDRQIYTPLARPQFSSDGAEQLLLLRLASERPATDQTQFGTPDDHEVPNSSIDWEVLTDSGWDDILQ